MYIGGKWRAAETGAFIETFNPSNGELLGAAPAGAKCDVDDAIRAARECFEKDWSKRPAPEREHMLLKFAALLDKHRNELAVLETLNNETLLSHMTGSVIDFWIETVTYFAGWATKTAGQTLPPPHQYIPASGEGFSFTLREPVGVVCAILPWNAPASFLINKAAPALAAGCTMIAKPAEQTPITALYLAQLFEEAGFPSGAVNIVTGYGHDVGAALAQHPDVNRVSFTGSSSVGKKIARDSADSLKHLTLELGGKSSFVVMADADLDAAIQPMAA